MSGTREGAGPEDIVDEPVEQAAMTPETTMSRTTVERGTASRTRCVDMDGSSGNGRVEQEMRQSSRLLDDGSASSICSMRSISVL